MRKTMGLPEIPPTIGCVQEVQSVGYMPDSFGVKEPKLEKVFMMVTKRLVS